MQTLTQPQEPRAQLRPLLGLEDVVGYDAVVGAKEQHEHFGGARGPRHQPKGAIGGDGAAGRTSHDVGDDVPFKHLVVIDEGGL